MLKLGMYRKFIHLYSRYELLKYRIKKLCFGHELATTMLQNCHKESAILILRSEGAKIGENCDINVPLFIHNAKSFEKLELGDNVHIGKNCFLDLAEEISIGNNTTISMCNILITHIDTGSSGWDKIFKNNCKPIKIGQNVYMGTNCTILPGCSIFNIVFIGANSLITKDVNEAGIYFGQPAKKQIR
jgi:acetyltransferase-like isoleucine patch superfamily enzyme